MAQELRREIGLFGAVAYGVGTIVGAGVYALIGVAAGRAGNAVWLSFVIAAVVALFSGLSYARLSSIFPVSGAEYVYVEEAYQTRRGAFIVGWLVMLSSLISASAVALGFGGYVQAYFAVPAPVSAALLIIVLSAVNFIGIKESMMVNVVLTLIELSGIVVMIVLGAGHIGAVDYTVAPGGIAGVIGAVSIIFFAFVGFEGLAKIGDETKNPTKTIPLALMISLLISTVLYVLVALAVVSILPYGQLAASSSPLSDVALQAQGPTLALLLSMIALISTANTVLIILISTSRIAYGMSMESALPALFKAVHARRGTPHLAIALTMLAAIFFCFLGGIEFTANVANFTIFLVFLAVNLSLIQFYRKGVKVGRLYALSAVLGVASSILLLTQFSWEVFALSLIIIAIGLAVYRLVAFDLR
jgi:APA family basic amino acid/polyamine antiporter